ncbi:preprotein translocase subunit SecE [Cruoricaptor ignavus]|uniref:Protein translocase subunit SecE n=1 Tax=Cruoricaptor ignavus TaxID=1118202 RepID=A0A7M1T4P0_9FLAO|nr:preprotein translocase subunit SecE [Cruoricaptor ignavus]QOR74721.1 preprotein translocase subunit SecE [Cruoricaptor ignavus]
MSLVNYIKDSFYEFRHKVEWPKWADLQQSAVVVTVSTILLSLFTFGVDELFAKAIRNILTLLINLFN